MKLFLRATGKPGTPIALYDENGDMIPGQCAVTLRTDIGDTPRIDVTIIADQRSVIVDLVPDQAARREPDIAAGESTRKVK